MLSHTSKDLHKIPQQNTRIWMIKLYFEKTYNLMHLTLNNSFNFHRLIQY